MPVSSDRFRIGRALQAGGHWFDPGTAHRIVTSFVIRDGHSLAGALSAKLSDMSSKVLNERITPGPVAASYRLTRVRSRLFPAPMSRGGGKQPPTS